MIRALVTLAQRLNMMGFAIPSAFQKRRTRGPTANLALVAVQLLDDSTLGSVPYHTKYSPGLAIWRRKAIRNIDRFIHILFFYSRPLPDLLEVM
jgi:hypothetical protein